ncbi:PhzF family phenazine biosynthesis protein [Candidimonas humi]|uniref:PhzF family phenazine biosynthesis protein n=1 Tax=Candidimonas humi TaxID=683355 RepID=A0ABV8P3U8_9BURK|nr:PhzF family phenazine biosynthesis protein [Candidimonas humi]MBV6306242.1 PhzF family phenazine biosynthesis protein [Candidimonas humi]
MPTLDFKQVDVFSATPLKGNPLAVVIGADELDEAGMAAFANWTNLSETTFLLRPTAAGADYRVRIFTPRAELPFAGHPTLGSCHVWLAAGGRPQGQEVVQECQAGLIRLRRDGSRLAFAAPPLLRSGVPDASLLERVASGLLIERTAIRGAQWVDNGPGWLAVMLGSRAEVLALRPDMAALGDLKIGVVAPWDAARDGGEASFEVRAFVPGIGVPEDPVTGSLNAGLAQWLIGSGQAPDAYVASQGTALGRAGRVHVQRLGDDIWIGGETAVCIEGRVNL